VETRGALVEIGVTEIVSGCEMDSSGSKQGTGSGSCEHDGDPWAPTEGRAERLQTDFCLATPAGQIQGRHMHSCSSPVQTGFWWQGL
jgi:hypothetical protein